MIEPSNLPTIDSAYLLVDCVFLSSFEQEQFIKTDHNYLIEQLQLQEDNISTERDSTSLVFDKPCKVLIWNILLHCVSNIS